MKTTLRAASILALMTAPAMAQTTSFYSFADTDQDGFISSDELTAVSPAFTPTVYTYFDAEQTGTVSVEEFGNSPLLRGFTFSSPAQFRRDAPRIVRRYGSYRVIDTNGDGILSAGEISAVVPSVTRTRYVSADLNRDGVLDFSELYGWNYYSRLEDSGAVLLPREAADQNTIIQDRVRYTRIDLNRDGFISMKELARIAPGATLEQFAAVDANDDGVVVYSELYDSDLVGEEVMQGVFTLPGKTKMATTTTTTETTSPSYALDSYTFALLDSDDDNLMTLDELQAAIPTMQTTEMKGIDVDGDGYIRYDEFFSSPVVTRYYESNAITVPSRRVSIERSYFTGIDRDRNGFIDENEMMEVSPSVTRTVYSGVDANGDGMVTYDELYGNGWLTQAMEDDSVITPAYVYRYYAPKEL